MISEAEYRMMQARTEKAPAAPPTATTDEGELQEQIIAYCRGRGWWVDYSRMDLPTTRPLGAPDLTIYADHGRFYVVECKAKGGKMRPEQLGVKLALANLGHTVHVVYSFEEFLTILDFPSGMSAG